MLRRNLSMWLGALELAALGWLAYSWRQGDLPAERFRQPALATALGISITQFLLKAPSTRILAAALMLCLAVVMISFTPLALLLAIAAFLTLFRPGAEHKENSAECI